jgi:hypothetical protein
MSFCNRLLDLLVRGETLDVGATDYMGNHHETNARYKSPLASDKGCVAKE